MTSGRGSEGTTFWGYATHAGKFENRAKSIFPQINRFCCCSPEWSAPCAPSIAASVTAAWPSSTTTAHTYTIASGSGTGKYEKKEIIPYLSFCKKNSSVYKCGKMFSTVVLLLLGKLKQFILCFAKLEIFCSIYKCFSRSQGLVPDLHPFCGHQLHHHHLLRLLLHQRGGLEAPLRHRAGGGPHLLRSRVAAIRIHGKQIVEFSQKLLTFF